MLASRSVTAIPLHCSGAYMGERATSRRMEDPGHQDPQRSRQALAATPESEALHRAAAHCHAAFAYCTSDGRGVHDLEDLLCLIDCAELCLATAGFVARNGNYAEELRNLCSQQLQDVQETLADYRDDEVLQACSRVLHDGFDALQAGVVGID
jgi:hypothetical protein